MVAATHGIEDEIAAGRFRADLFYRLNVLPVQVVPLRDRRSEIPELIAYFAEGLKSVAQPITLAPGLSSLLQAYDWPGNVRELSNTVHRLLLYPGQRLTCTMSTRLCCRLARWRAYLNCRPPVGIMVDAFESLIEADQADAASDAAAQKFLQDSVDALKTPGG